MKKLFTFLEEKRVLVFALTSLVALTVLTAVAVYQVRHAQAQGRYTAEESGEAGLLEANGEDGQQGDGPVLSDQNVAEVGAEGSEVSGSDLADGKDQGENGMDFAALGEEEGPSEDGIPNAEDVGRQTLVEEQTASPVEEAVQQENVPVQASQVAAVNLAFDGSQKLSWPVESRTLLMDFSMDSTVYFATLNQYKVSRGILIQEEPGQPVFAPADCLVTEVGSNEEIGNYVALQLGSQYSAILGNLSNVTVAPNQYLLEGTVLGTLAEPTKYYVVEGPNLYFEVRNEQGAVDPLSYLD